MIQLIHTNNKVVAVSQDAKKLSGYEGENCVKALFELTKKFPDELIIWHEASFKDAIAWNEINTVFHHKRIMASYSFAEYYLSPSIGYVEDSPFLKVLKQVQFPTWQMSSDIGGVFSEVLLQIPETFWKTKDFLYLLNSIGKCLQQKGILCYSSPQLVFNKRVLSEVKNKKVTKTVLFKFVKQHYKTRWVFLLFLNLFISEKKLPLLALLNTFFIAKRKTNNIEISKIAVQSTRKTTNQTSIDVVIPTIGRSACLYDVITDLSKQTKLPKNVIIVEQTSNNLKVSELDYLTSDTWPFKIIHHFIKQTGACNARNIALKEVKSSWVFFADDDIRLNKDFLSTCIDTISQFKSDAFTVSCLRKNETEAVQNVKQWSSFGSGCSIVNAKIATKINYDLAFEYGFGEDKDYGMQLRNKGIDILYNPFAKLLHLKAPDGGFREVMIKPKNEATISPKPSQTIMLYYNRYSTLQQLKGYKLQLFIKFYRSQEIRNPLRYLSVMKKRWNLSVQLAKDLNKK